MCGEGGTFIHIYAQAWSFFCGGGEGGGSTFLEFGNVLATGLLFCFFSFFFGGGGG